MNELTSASAITIREAVAADVPATARMLADDMLGGGRENPDDLAAYQAAFAAMARQGGNRVLVACDGAEVIGCVQIVVIPGLSLTGATRAELEGVRVAGTRRGQGIGERLIGTAIEAARAVGATLVQLTTNAARTDAQRFYRRFGFAPSHVGMKLKLGPT